MKLLWLFPFIFCFANSSSAQRPDSLLLLLEKAKEDTNKVRLLGLLSQEYYLYNPDTAMLLVQEGLDLAMKIDFAKGQARLLSYMGDVYLSFGNYSKDLELQLRSLEISEKIKAPEETTNALHSIALLYSDQQESRLSLSYFLKENEILKKYPSGDGLLWNQLNIVKAYRILNRLDSSQFYLSQSLESARKLYGNHFPGDLLNTLGELYYYRGEYEKAFLFYRQSIPDLINKQSYQQICESYLGLAKLHKTVRDTDSSVYYAKRSLQIAQQKGLLFSQLSSAGFLTTLYKSLENIDSAFLYQELNTKVHDSLFSLNKVKEFQKIRFSRQIEQREIQALKAAYQSRIKFNILGGVLTTFLLLAIILFRSNQHKQKANFLLNKQKEEIDAQKSKVEKAYRELQSTQAQLIQSEKMASLGELTAGIAHEIQNPLNFVNNFSEVNKELLAEMKEQIDKGNTEEVKALANDIIDNEEKINQHGQRADAIVKGMLQHSRKSPGAKEPTDINKLADEYLRLAYHGLRAKDKSFNVKFQTDFDPSVGKLNLIPQDIGRAILNLINNAFYAAPLSSRQVGTGSDGGFKDPNYKQEPTVWVSTKKAGDKIFISVKDNGPGIPQKILDKIFQPFFTTKPAGLGTGLGLSLAYDIVKAHGGELKVETKEGEGSEFIIQLPVV